MLTKGLPASGKTTWAKKYQEDNPNTVRVNKDDLRAMLHNSVHSKGRESFVLNVRDYVVEKALKEGHDVIVDDTNLNPDHQIHLERLAKGLNAEFEVVDFTNVDMEECIKRDKQRQKSVGAGVIRDMYQKYLYRPVEAPQIDPAKPWCIICDIDGTLAIKGDRSPYDYTKVHLDTPNWPVFDVLSVYSSLDEENPHWEPVRIMIFSGREDTCEKETKKWLEDHGLDYYHELHMRKAGDKRDDRIVKQEMYEQFIKDKYNVKFVLDDRDRVVAMWRSLGLSCFQVNYGNF